LKGFMSKMQKIPGMVFTLAMSTDHWECDFLCDLMKVCIAFFHVVLSSGEVRTDKTHGGIV